MIVKKIVDERFDDYRLPSMFICTASCGGKCCKEAGIPFSVCQNDEWRSAATVAMPDDDIIKRYLSNHLTRAICFAGLEPFEQFDELFNFISTLRRKYYCGDTVVIYTGYNKTEILSQVEALQMFKNIVIKFGRYVPNQKPHFDNVLGVSLASDNQYAERIS